MNNPIKALLIEDRSNIEGLKDFFRLWSFYELRTGIYTPLERLGLKYPNATFYYSNDDHVFSSAFLARNTDCKTYEDQEIALKIHLSENYFSWNILNNVKNQLLKDFELFKKTLEAWPTISNEIQVVGDRHDLFIHPSAKIYPGNLFDVSSGPIMIDEFVKITPFSFIERPLYVAKNSTINNARITDGCVIGSHYSVEGELSNAILGNYSNCAHAGNLNNSLFGDWVNLGRLGGSSNLNLNYSSVKISFNNDLRLDTGNLKFGCVLGDYSKISGGVIMAPGTFVDIACVLSDARISGYYAPFTWMKHDRKYTLERFMDNCDQILDRKEVQLSKQEKKLIRKFHKELCGSETLALQN